MQSSLLLNKECDNKARCHVPRTIIENDDAIRVICETCKHQYILRKDNRGVPEKRAYIKIFRKDSLQGNANLFYKYFPEHLRV